MRTLETNSRISPTTLRQAGELFAAHQQTIYQSTDRMFAVLMSIQWIAGIVAAIWIAPRTWMGTVSHTHIHVWASIFLGGAISFFPITLAILRPGTTTTRYVIASGQMLMSALLIYLTGGRIETHFHVFGSLAFLSFYRDWRVLVPATIVVAADHFLRGVFWPQSVYGVLSASEWRWLEHAGWVLFEDAFLFIAIRRSVAEMWDIAVRTAETNDLNQSLERRVAQRTAEIVSVNEGLQREIAERKLAEGALRNSEKRYRLLFESNPLPMWVYDSETLSFLAVNEAATRHYGYSREEFLAMEITNIRPPENIPALVESVPKASSGLHEAGVWKHRKKDGTLIDVEITSHALQFTGRPAKLVLANDVTERLCVEQELLGQRLFLRQVIDLNPSFIFAKDREGRFTLVNQALAEAYGTTVENLLGKTDADFNPNTKEVEHFRHDDLEVMNAQREKIIPEEIITDSEGRVRWLQTVKRPLTASDGTTDQILGVATDITGHKLAEEQLRQVQKMESIGTLAGGIAHDFNNLMTAVTGYSELALRSLVKDDSLRPKIEEIKKAGERASSLTRQLLAFSRKQMLQPKVLDLNSVVADMAKMLPRVIGEHIDLRLRLSNSLGRIKADPGQIEQVLLNLAVNARDAMPEGGSLSIKTENVHLNEKVGRKHSVIKPGHYVLMSLSDTGHGMDAETQSHIFEPFFTTKEVGRGTGMGLSTVYGIVKQSGGSVWVYSEVGKGTNFKIYLPRVDEIVENEVIGSDSTAVARGRETVLLVEDEEVVRELSKEILETYGYSVLVASNGKEGLRIGKEFEGRIDLVITDVIMPQMSGREMADGLKVFRPDTGILFMSGFTDDAIVHHGVLDDGVFFIEKPFSPDSLAVKAREVLDHARSS